MVILCLKNIKYTIQLNFTLKNNQLVLINILYFSLK